MKNRVVSFILLLSISIMSFSCKQETKDNPKSETQTEQETKRTHEMEKSEKKPSPDAKLAFEETQQYEIMRLYLDLKNALIKADAYAAKKIAEILMMRLEKDSDAYLSAQKITQYEEDIEQQRTAFFELSKNVESLIIPHIKSGTLYKQYCPMAFDNEGGFWFAEQKEILNPYFGDKMLHCGEITETYF